MGIQVVLVALQGMRRGSSLERFRRNLMMFQNIFAVFQRRYKGVLKCFRGSRVRYMGSKRIQMRNAGVLGVLKDLRSALGGGLL